MSTMPETFDLTSLRRAYAEGSITPEQVALEALRRADDDPRFPHVWIEKISREKLLELARPARQAGCHELPLYGVPFAIKDNIDLVGLPTTVGCPDFAFQPAESATVVHRLIAAGAMPICKTNLDQFATGLVGVRSPVWHLPVRF